MSAELVEALERTLLDPAVRGSREAASALLADDFLEFGSDGHAYDKAAMLNLLAADPAFGESEPKVDHLHVRMLASSIALVTYRSTARGKHSLRASLWQERGGHWRMVFHQGTSA
jgi:hypothetical protein